MRASRGRCRSTENTRAPNSARTAAWYPLPVPISSTRSPGCGSKSAVIVATVNGCEIVCPSPMGTAMSW